MQTPAAIPPADDGAPRSRAPRRNRVDPWADLHAVPARGMFTGNRGCLVDGSETVVRHHAGDLWITCRTQYRGWRSPLAATRHWTPLFFLDDAVALAAGHRPCATCRRDDYLSYRDAVTRAVDAPEPLRAWQLNDRLRRERLLPGRGVDRARDRHLWSADPANLPDGTVVLDDVRTPCLLLGRRLLRFTFDGWVAVGDHLPEPVLVLTPPTSVAALAYGFRPVLDDSAQPGGVGVPPS